MFMYRLGQFLLISGLVLLIIFFATDQLRDPQFCLFFWGAGAFSLGAYLIWRNYQPPPRAGERFRTVRRISRNYSDWRVKRKEKAAQKKKK